MKFKFLCSNCFAPPSQPINRTKNGQHEQTLDDLCVFSYNQLKIATDSFHSSNKIGEGGFGSVYKGLLKDGTVVAVKVLAVELESMRGEREFISEIAALSDIKHPNLVNLQGCCIDGADRFLVYDYMENNSLAHTLLGREEKRMKFGWEVRRDIALGIARGLAFLHEEVVPHIVHRDIKASNILLDRNFMPKVSDFGLSRLLRDNISHISTRVAGTLGYIAPEYAISGRLTRKSDVYSFGVLLLEIISGRSVVDFNLELGEHYLVQKAWDIYKADKLLQIADHTLEMKFPEEEAVRFLKVGLLCVQETARLRPRMSMVVKMLGGEVEVKGEEILQPGLLVDLMDIKVRQKDNLKHSMIARKGPRVLPSFDLLILNSSDCLWL